jgi:hypothetical protein
MLPFLQVLLFSSPQKRPCIAASKSFLEFLTTPNDIMGAAQCPIDDALTGYPADAAHCIKCDSRHSDDPITQTIRTASGRCRSYLLNHRKLFHTTVSEVVMAVSMWKMFVELHIPIGTTLARQDTSME